MTRGALGVCVAAILLGCSSNSPSSTPAGSGGVASSSGVGEGDGGSTPGGSTTGYGPDDAGTTGDGSSTCGTGYGAGVGNGGTMSWEYDGATECAFLLEATHAIDSTMDFIEIVGSTSANAAIDISVASYVGPLGGTYSCTTDGGFEVIFVYLGTTMTDCTVTIARAGSSGVNAQGTFSASDASEGGTFTITDGVFDVPVTVTDGG